MGGKYKIQHWRLVKKLDHYVALIKVYHYPDK